jgi:predicted amino acid-binding ACT domain protein
MTESAKHIKNPLTLISIFAGAAELSGVAILPLIENPNQWLYILFLIFFPTFIIILFFATLNFNHKVLYAPSDYKDENNFVNPFGRATPEEVTRKLDDETREVQADAESQAGLSTDPTKAVGEVSTDKFASQSNPDTKAAEDLEASARDQSSQQNDRSPSDIPSEPIKVNPERTSQKGLDSPQDDAHTAEATRLHSATAKLIQNAFPTYPSSLHSKVSAFIEPYASEHRNLMANVALTEKLAVSKLSKALNIDFRPDVSFRPHNSTTKYIFDAATYSSDEIQVVEVKLFANRFEPRRYADTIIKAHNLSRTFKDKKLTLHLVVVLANSKLSPTEVRNQMDEVIGGYGFEILVHVTTTADLQNEVGGFY